MNMSLYGERDYAFGKLILTLRTQIGLTQSGLAERLHISRRAVTEWEAGSTYPTSHHLQQLIALGVQQQAFAAGREAEEIRALWQAAHQKVLLNDAWLDSLLGRSRPALTLLHPQAQGASRPGELPAVQPKPAPLLDWGEALNVPTFYGREPELATLSRWVVEEDCRMVSVLGMGGIGKSALVVRTMRALAGHFDVVLFRSLRDAPSCEALLESCLAVLVPESLALGQESLENRLSLLLEELRSRRVLLVLDNLEVLLSEGEVLGRLRPGYEGYGQLLRQVAETAHQSCLLLTSREKPAALRALEGSRTLVRSLRLPGLEAAACAQLLAEHEVDGSPEEQARLGEVYAGNPLALNIVAETIADLFGGAIDPFLAGGTVIFGSITQLLEEQWARLSPLEQTALSWLAILREPVNIADLLGVLVATVAHAQVLEAVDGLRRRSLIERGQHAGSFTLQSVILEYVTAKLVAVASEEIQQGRLLRLREHGLSRAQAKDYVRESQERLLLAPLLARLESVYQGRAEVEAQLRALLAALRGQAEEAQGYGPANLVALLRRLCGDLRGLDLSHLALRGAYLQGVEMQDANLSGALMRACVFREAFDAITALSISESGQYWAAISRRGEVRVWREGGQMLHLAWQAHTDNTLALAFSPDERTLASGSHDGSVKLWDVASSALLWSGRHTKGTICLAFSADGRLLASGGLDATARLWDVHSGTPLEEVPHPSPVGELAWSPGGRLLASGDSAGTVRLWERHKTRPATCVQTLEGHTRPVRGLAFAPDASLLASASYDGTIKLWEVGGGSGPHLCQTLVGHTEGVQSLVWSPDGSTLASGGLDHTIRLWDVEKMRARAVLQAHSAIVYGLAFTPDSQSVLSGSEDGTLRLWQTQSGELLNVMQGYTHLLYDLAWSPDGTRLACAGSDSLVTLWDRERSVAPLVLGGHRWSVFGVTWSPDGSLLASCGLDHTIRLWDPTTGTCVQVLRDHDAPDTVFFSVAWNPEGHFLASGTLVRGVLLWDLATHSQRAM
ncbi:MAG TPA: NB-ARC domain-containing protein, partial [Ktedonobacteraceae bacterium]